MKFKATVATVLVSLALVCYASAEPTQSVPTNSLAVHLKSLGRSPTVEEREIIKAALRLMQRHEIRSDYPLKSIKRDGAKKEWVLDFDGSKPRTNEFVSDAQFFLFLQGKDAHYVEVHWAGTTWRTRYPAERKREAK
jgi:hypothetical protein